MRRVALAAFLLLLVNDPAGACGVVEGWAADWVDRSSVILRARAVAQGDRAMSEDELAGRAGTVYARPDGRMSTVQFELIEVLKGQAPATLEFDGELSEGVPPHRGPAPRLYVRPDYLYTSCHAHLYMRGAEYLLMLNDEDGQLTPYWADGAATNEDLTGERDPWLDWVRDYLQLKRSGQAGTIEAACWAGMEFHSDRACEFRAYGNLYSLDGRGKLTRYPDSVRLPVAADVSLHHAAFAEIDGDLLLTFEVGDAESGESEMVNAFERPRIGPSEVTFVEAGADARQPRSVIVDKATGRIRRP